MKIGNLNINNVKLGNTQINKVYLGNNLVWENFNKLLGAVGVYGLYKINPLYSGPSIRIRRCSDNVETNIGFDINGKLDKVSLINFITYRNQVKNTNLIAYSPTNYFWVYQVGTNTYTTGQEDAFGGNNGTKITSTTSTIPMIGTNSPMTPIMNGTKVTVSVHCKAVEANVVRVGSLLGNGRVEYNLSTQTATSVGSAVVSHSITDVGNGWFRVSSTYNFDNPVSNSYLYGGFGCNTIANGVNGMLFSHPQIEFGELTEFQHNLTSQPSGNNNVTLFNVVTVYDQSGNGYNLTQSIFSFQPFITYDNDGEPYFAFFNKNFTNLSYSYLNGVNGYTLYCKYRTDITTGAAKTLTAIFNGTIGNFSNSSKIRVNSTNRLNQEARFTGTATVNLLQSNGMAPINTFHKVAGSFQIDNSRSYADGNKIGEDLVGMVADSQILIWGATNNGSEVMNGFSQELIIYNEDKDDDFLDKLTT